MTQPIHRSDRMPAVAQGRDAWSPEDERHLADCAQCADEWRLVLAAGELGREVEAQLDVDALAASVTARLRETPIPRIRRFPPVRWIAVAALAAAVVLAVLLRPTSPGDQAETTVAQEALLPELEGLNAEELETLLGAIPVLDPGPGVGQIPDLNDLNEDDLERLLRTLEG